jgi:hypothetical protein
VLEAHYGRGDPIKVEELEKLQVVALDVDLE